MNLGVIIRRYRKKAGLTLKAASEKAGISEGFLSQVENNVKSPSVETLRHICEAIDVGLAEMMGQLENQENLVLIRRSEWEDVDFSHTGFATRRFGAPENRTVIDTALLFLRPGASIPVRKNVKNGQEILSVLQGSLTLSHGGREEEMFEGDTVHLWTEPNRQSIANQGEQTAVILWVGTI